MQVTDPPRTAAERLRWALAPLLQPLLAFAIISQAVHAASLLAALLAWSVSCPSAALALAPVVYIALGAAQARHSSRAVSATSCAASLESHKDGHACMHACGCITGHEQAPGGGVMGKRSAAHKHAQQAWWGFAEQVLLVAAAKRALIGRLRPGATWKKNDGFNLQRTLMLTAQIPFGHTFVRRRLHTL